MNQVFSVTTNVNGEQRRENVLIEWQNGDDLWYMLPKLALKLTMSSEGQKKYIGTGLSFSELITHAPPELLMSHNISIRWLDREAVCMDDCTLVSRFEMESYLELFKNIDRREKRAIEVAVQYIRRLVRLHAEGHPLVSTWDDTRMFDWALSWAGLVSSSSRRQTKCTLAGFSRSGWLKRFTGLACLPRAQTESANRMPLRVLTGTMNRISPRQVDKRAVMGRNHGRLFSCRPSPRPCGRIFSSCQTPWCDGKSQNRLKGI